MIHTEGLGYLDWQDFYTRSCLMHNLSMYSVQCSGAGESWAVSVSQTAPRVPNRALDPGEDMRVNRLVLVVLIHWAVGAEHGELYSSTGIFMSCHTQ